MADKDQLVNDMDDLTSKLTDAEVVKDTALKGKAESEAITSEHKRIFETNNFHLEQDNQTAEVDPEVTEVIYNKNLNVGL